MKPALLAVCAMLSACAASPSPNAPLYTRTDPPPPPTACSPSAKPETWAVIAGVDRYEDPRIAPLQGAVNDAWIFYHTLSSPSGMAIHPSRLKLLLGRDATLANMRDALGTFLSQACPQDQIVIFFAGHGVTEPGRPEEGFLLVYDTDVEKLVGSSLSMSRLPDFLAWRTSRAGRLLLLVDACHSGGIQFPNERGVTTTGRPRLGSESFAGAFSGRPGWGAFSAATQQQSALELGASNAGCLLGDVPFPGGLFTCHLIRGMSGAADTDDDRTVTWGELRQHVTKAVEKASDGRQSPLTSGQLDDGLVFSTVPKTPLAIPSVPTGINETRDPNALEPWVWGAASLAGVAAASGALFHVLANASAQDINDQTAQNPDARSRAQAERQRQDHDKLVLTSQIGYGAALTLGMASLILLSADAWDGAQDIEDVYRQPPWFRIQIGPVPSGAIGTVSFPWP